MITFSGNLVLTADEGEPRLGYGSDTVDPKGSVTVLDLSGGVTGGAVTVVSFDSFDAQRDALTQAGVLIKKGAAPSVDFSSDGRGRCARGDGLRVCFGIYLRKESAYCR